MKKHEFAAKMAIKHLTKNNSNSNGQLADIKKFGIIVTCFLFNPISFGVPFIFWLFLSLFCVLFWFLLRFLMFSFCFSDVFLIFHMFLCFCFFFWIFLSLIFCFFVLFCVFTIFLIFMFVFSDLDGFAHVSDVFWFLFCFFQFAWFFDFSSVCSDLWHFLTRLIFLRFFLDLLFLLFFWLFYVSIVLCFLFSFRFLSFSVFSDVFWLRLMFNDLIQRKSWFPTPNATESRSIQHIRPMERQGRNINLVNAAHKIPMKPKQISNKQKSCSDIEEQNTNDYINYLNQTKGSKSYEKLTLLKLVKVKSRRQYIKLILFANCKNLTLINGTTLQKSAKKT